MVMSQFKSKYIFYYCREDYFRMKLQWKSVTEDQEGRFFTLRDRKNLIGNVYSFLGMKFPRIF